jgi:hypothetical protein
MIVNTTISGFIVAGAPTIPVSSVSDSDFLLAIARSPKT